MRSGESLVRALQRELEEETGLFPPGTEVPLEGPVALVDSIAPEPSPWRKHVVHVIFAADLSGSLEESPRRTRLFAGIVHFGSRSSIPFRCTLRSSGSCSDGNPVIRPFTSARCGCRRRRASFTLSRRFRDFRYPTREHFRVTLAAGGGLGCPSEISLLAATPAVAGPPRRYPKRLSLEFVG